MVGDRPGLETDKAIADLIELSGHLLDRIRAGEWINAGDLDQERFQRLAALFRSVSVDELSRCCDGLQRLRDIDSQLLAAGREARYEHAHQCKSLQELKKRHQAYTQCELTRR
jgi:hypothetical protein